jgi:putative ABC transport system ATP-binding protein
VIEIDELTKTYRTAGGIGVDVLRGVSCRIQAGDFVAIMGPSGSGKTTLLNILGYLEKPDSGSYRLDGADYSAADDDTLSGVRNRKIGFVFQQFPLLDRVSALRNVMLPLLYRDDDAPDGEARGTRALEAVGLAARAQHRPSELSGGEQQRVGIARALVNDPAVILADEPTGNLDAKSAGEILDILSGLRTGGRTIVLVTHDAAVAERADRVLLLESGRLVPARAMA